MASSRKLVGKLTVLTIFSLFRTAFCEISAESVFEILSHSLSKITDRVDNIENDIAVVKERIENIETLVKNPKEFDKTLEAYSKTLKQDLSAQRSAVFRLMSDEKNTVREEVINLNRKFIELATDLRSEVTEFRENLTKQFSSTKETLNIHAEELILIANNNTNLVKNSINEIREELNYTSEELMRNFDEKGTNLTDDLQKVTERLGKRISDQENQMSSKTSALSSRISSESSSLSSRISSLSSQYSSLSSRMSSEYSSLSSSISSKYSSLSSTISSKYSSLSSSISSLSSRISAEEERKVGFTARMTKADSYYVKSERIKFDQVYYNHGSGYSSSTGTFTAPKSGTYLFSFTVGATKDGKIHAILNVDGNMRASALAGKEVDETGSNTAVVYVYKGDRVWVETANLETRYYIWPYRTMFSGVLID